MSLSATLQNAALSAFNAIGDLAKDAVYSHIVRGPVNPATDARSDTTTTVDIKVTVAASGALYPRDVMLTRDEYSGKLIVATPVLLMNGTVPTQGDTITLNGAGVVYTVEGFRKDPANAMYEFLVDIAR